MTYFCVIRFLARCLIFNITKIAIMDFLKDNSVWITPLLVAIVGGIISGIFYLIKKGGKSNKQTIKDVHNSTINQVNGNNNESRK